MENVYVEESCAEQCKIGSHTRCQTLAPVQLLQSSAEVFGPPLK